MKRKLTLESPQISNKRRKLNCENINKLDNICNNVNNINNKEEKFITLKNGNSRRKRINFSKKSKIKIEKNKLIQLNNHDDLFKCHPKSLFSNPQKILFKFLILKSPYCSIN